MARRKVNRSPTQPITVNRTPERELGYYETQLEMAMRLPTDEALLGTAALAGASAASGRSLEVSAWSAQADLHQYNVVPGVTASAVVKEAYRPQVEAKL